MNTITHCHPSGWNENCELYKLFDMLGKKWVIFIIFLLDEGATGFNEIQKTLTHLNAKTLSQRLKLLQEHKLIDKKITSISPVKISYVLTSQGKKIAQKIRSFKTFVKEE